MTWMSREDLFNAAWERPLTTVATELGVTSTALKKTCDRHDIPTPGRGYWAQVAAGGTFPKPKLRPAKAGRREEVSIQGPRALPPAVQAARVAAQENVRAARPPKVRATPATPAPVDLGEPTARATEALDLEEPAVLAATGKALRRGRPDDAGFLSVRGKGVVSTTLGEPSVERALRVLARLVRAAEGKGRTVKPTDHGVALVVAGEAIGFRLEEKHRRTPHQPTPKELKEKAERMRWDLDHRPLAEIRPRALRGPPSAGCRSPRRGRARLPRS